MRSDGAAYLEEYIFTSLLGTATMVPGASLVLLGSSSSMIHSGYLQSTLGTQILCARNNIDHS